MSQYFDDTLKNYYDKLTSSPIDPSTIKEHITVLGEKTKSLLSRIDNSKWKENGKDVLKTTILPKVNSKINIFINNINSNLIPAAEKAKNDLYPILSKMNEKESEIIALKQRIDGGNDSSELSTKYNELVEEINGLSSKAYSYIEEIKKLNGILNLDGTSTVVIDTTPKAVEETKQEFVPVAASATITTEPPEEEVYVPYAPNEEFDENEIIEARKKTMAKRKKLFGNSVFDNFIKIHKRIQAKKYNMGEYDPVSLEDEKLDPSINDKVAKFSTLGSEWIVANTAISAKDYEVYAYSKGIRQDSNSSRYGDACLAFSHVHAANMKTGYTGDNAESAMAWKYSSSFKDYFTNDKQQVMNTIYDEITNGNPVIIQVNGNKEGTVRHFVTVVGFNSSVTSASTLKDKDLLILDSWDCRLEAMNTSTSRFLTTGAQTGKTYSGYYLRLFK